MANVVMQIAQNVATYANSAAGYVVYYAALIYALSGAGQPDRQTSANRVTVNQTMPPRKRVINRARIMTDDSRMLHESKRNMYKINAICQAHGSLVRFDRYWLHSDEVTVKVDNDRVEATDGNPNKYNGNGIWWLTRRGLPTETSYYSEGNWHTEDLSELGAGVWTEDHRGDGIASLLLVCAPVEQTSYRNVYPHGHPVPSILPVMAVYDWRKDSTRGGSGAHRIDDVTTWEESWNVALWWAQVECGPIEREDFVERFERKIDAALDSWTQAANDCDDLYEGLPRYQIAGWYYDDEPLAEIRKKIMATCDGFIMELPGGALHVQVGKYRAPNLTIPRAHITALRWKRGKSIDKAVNELIVSYVSADHDWFVVPGTPWRDEDDISARGRKPKDFACPWVPQHAQAQYLAKIKHGQEMGDGEGTARIDLYGLNVLFAAPPEGEVANRRWINLERETADGSVEIVPVELLSSPPIDIKALSVEFAVRRAVPDAYDRADDDGGPDVPPDPIPGFGWLNGALAEQGALLQAVT